jgi:hypothetical protein
MKVLETTFYRYIGYARMVDRYRSTEILVCLNQGAHYAGHGDVKVYS